MAKSGEIRQVTSVGMLKALADPVRLAILTTLMRDKPRVMSVKELAAELNEPQTKLYRHVKQLESAGLIGVASTRVVSGITEQRYQACQASLVLGPEFMSGPGRGHKGEVAAMVTAFLDRYLNRFLDRREADGTRREDGEPADGRNMLLMTETLVSPATAQLIRGKLQEIAEALDQQAPAGEAAVPVEVLLGFLGPVALEELVPSSAGVRGARLIGGQGHRYAQAVRGRRSGLGCAAVGSGDFCHDGQPES
jgi:DNA-binding transcriptional ArsR family regulator